MKKLYIILLTIVLSSSDKIYSQKVDGSSEITIEDFNLHDSSVFLEDMKSVKFDYHQYYHLPGAFDETFTMKYGRTFRYLRYNGDSDDILLMTSEIKAKPDINSCRIYFIQNNKVKTEKVKPGNLSLINKEEGLFLKVPEYKYFPGYIIEVNFDVEKESKDSIEIFLDRKKSCKHSEINISIPEILNYRLDYRNNCLQNEPPVEADGPIIGYKEREIRVRPNVWGEMYTYEMMRWILERDKNTSFEQVNCKSIGTKFLIDASCYNNDKDPNTLLLKLKLVSISDKYQPPFPYYKPKGSEAAK